MYCVQLIGETWNRTEDSALRMCVRLVDHSSILGSEADKIVVCFNFDSCIDIQRKII